MAGEGGKSCNFYSVLGLKKECSAAELRLAYKKLAMKWHPDRLSASGNPTYVEEAKKRFQAIQQAYSVLSDTNKRFLYDVGVYDCNDDDDNNGMGEFLNEMATMMTQTKSQENRNDTFEELQQLFDELFPSDIHEAFGNSSRSATPPAACSSSPVLSNETYVMSNKRNSTEMSSTNLRAKSSHFEGFRMGTGGMSSGKQQCGESSSRRKNTRKGQQ